MNLKNAKNYRECPKFSELVRPQLAAATVRQSHHRCLSPPQTSTPDVRRRRCLCLMSAVVADICARRLPPPSFVCQFRIFWLFLIFLNFRKFEISQFFWISDFSTFLDFSMFFVHRCDFVKNISNFRLKIEFSTLWDMRYYHKIHDQRG